MSVSQPLPTLEVKVGDRLAQTQAFKDWLVEMKISLERTYRVDLDWEKGLLIIYQYAVDENGKLFTVRDSEGELEVAKSGVLLMKLPPIAEPLYSILVKESKRRSVKE